MDKSPLGKLAPELRNKIYEEALYTPRCFHLVMANYSGYDGLTTYDQLEAQRAPALTQTCKEIRAETLQMFYALNTFTLTSLADSRSLGHWSTQSNQHYKSTLSACAKWLRGIPPIAVQALKRLTIGFAGGNVWNLGKRAAYWWKDGRALEKKLLHKLMNPSSIYIKFSMYTYDCGITRHISTGSGQHTCHLDILQLCSVITYELPTSDKKLARTEAERIVKAKAQQIEDYAKEYGCCVGVKLPQLQAGLESSRVAVLKAIGK